MRRLRHYSIVAALAVVMLSFFGSCRIEPPLKLVGREDVSVKFGEVIIDLELIWDVDADWRTRWWYGWDEEDIRQWGKIEYPEPSTYQLRLYYLGRESADSKFLTLSQFRVDEPRFRTRLDYGFHNVLAWSDIDSDDGTQVLLIDESDPTNIFATTSRTRSAVDITSRGVLNNPEIFYSGYEHGFEITDNPEDYDYFLPEENAWVKQLKTNLNPLVYIYLVQVVVYNNNGRIVGVTDNSVVSGVAAAVQLHTGKTSYNDALVSFEMRMKRDLPARDGRHADILGGKLTTFGLCDMEGWSLNRSVHYSGSRSELANGLHVGLKFVNETDSIYNFDITDQMRSQAHGGVITIEIDADTIPVPSRPSAGVPAGGFDPTIEPMDSVEHLFIM